MNITTYIPYHTIYTYYVTVNDRCEQKLKVSQLNLILTKAKKTGNKAKEKGKKNRIMLTWETKTLIPY